MGSLKNPIFRGVQEKTIYKVELLKIGGGGAWTVSRFKGSLVKKRVDIPMHTMTTVN